MTRATQDIIDHHVLCIYEGRLPHDSRLVPSDYAQARRLYPSDVDAQAQYLGHCLHQRQLKVIAAENLAAKQRRAKQGYTRLSAVIVTLSTKVAVAGIATCIVAEVGGQAALVVALPAASIYSVLKVCQALVSP